MSVDRRAKRGDERDTRESVVIRLQRDVDASVDDGVKVKIGGRDVINWQLRKTGDELRKCRARIARRPELRGQDELSSVACLQALEDAVGNGTLNLNPWRKSQIEPLQ